MSHPLNLLLILSLCFAHISLDYAQDEEQYSQESLSPSQSSSIPQPPPVGDCDEPMLRAIITNNIAKLYDMEWYYHYVVSDYLLQVGIDIETAEGITNLTCLVASISSLEDLTSLLGPYVQAEQRYRRITNHLKLLNYDDARQIFLKVKLVIDWMQTTGFPGMPLQHTSYQQTWQFFTDLQASMTDTTHAQMLVMFNLLVKEFGMVPPSATDTCYRKFFLSSPEALARVCHDPDHNHTALYDMFTDSWGVGSTLNSFRRTRLDVLRHIQTTAAAFVLSVFELVEHLTLLGWLDF